MIRVPWRYQDIDRINLDFQPIYSASELLDFKPSILDLIDFKEIDLKKNQVSLSKIITHEKNYNTCFARRITCIWSMQ